MKTAVILLLVVEVLLGIAVLLFVAKRRELRDVLLYGGVASGVVLVTGVVGNTLYMAAPERGDWGRIEDPHLVHWGVALALVPFAATCVAGYALRFRTVRAPKVLIVSTAMLGACLGLPVSQYMPLFGGMRTNGDPWSEARLDLLPGHGVALLFVGAAVGVFVVWRAATTTATRTPDSSPPSDGD